MKPAALECCEQETEFVNPQGANELLTLQNLDTKHIYLLS